ncbi:MAG: CARDB domain-containing protein, partial [Candidatus Kuenenbacteria bacterium]
NTILINAYWKNVGQAQANSGYDIKLEIYKNNSLVSNKTFTGQQALASGDSRTFYHRTAYSFDQAGDYTVKLMVDGDNVIGESDEGNNIIIKTVKVEEQKKSDFIVKSITPYFTAQVGNKISILIQFDDLYEDSNTLRDYDFKIDAPGATVGTSILTPNNNSQAWRTLIYNEPGTHTFTVTVDPENKIEETNENNNTLSYSIEVSPAPTNRPDLKFQSSEISVSNETITQGDNVSFDVYVENDSNINAGTAWVKYYFNGNQEANCSYEINFLSQGWSSVGCTLNSIQYTGDVKVEVKIDPDNLVNESNENNNTIFRTFKVGTVLTKPDLIIKDVDIKKHTGDNNYYFWMKYRNDGGASDWPGITYKIVDLDTNEEYITPLRVGGGSLPANWDDEIFLMTMGEIDESKLNRSFRLKATIDYLDEIDESNENNNTLIKTINVKSAGYYLQYTRDDGTTAPYYAYCDQPTDCVSSSNVCYDSGTRPFYNKRYICQAPYSVNTGRWYRCAEDKDLGKTVIGYTCQKLSDATYGWEKWIIAQPDLIVSDFSWLPSNPKAGEDVIMTISIKNIGQVKVSDKFWVTVAHNRDSEIVSDIIGGYKEERNVDVSGTITKSFKTKFTGSGDFAYTVLIPNTDKQRMYDNETYLPLNEANITNNSLTKTIAVNRGYSYYWSVGDWSACNNGKQTRTVECKFGLMGVVWDSLCVNAGPKPATEQICALLKSGDLFTIENRTDAVYYLGTDNKRYVIPFLNNSNIKTDTFNSWNVDQSKIKTVSQLTVEIYALGGNIVLRPGTNLIKTAANSTIYAIGPKGSLFAVNDSLNDLYGANWNSRLVTVPDVFFSNYTIGRDLVNSYPSGSFVKYSSNPNQIYLIYDGHKLPITHQGLTANNFSEKYITTISDNEVYSIGQTIDKEYACLTDMAQLATCSFVVPSDESKLKAEIINITPNMSALAGHTDQLLANVKLNAEDSSEDVRVTKLSFNHKTSIAGIHQYLSNLKLLDNSIVLSLSSDPDPVPTAGTDNTSVFALAEPLIIPKGTSKTLALAANISASAASGTTHQFSIISDSNILAFGQTSNNQIKVAGSYPLNGILITVATAGKFELVAGLGNPASAIYSGDTGDIKIGEIKFSSSLEDVTIEKLTFRPKLFNNTNLYSIFDIISLYDGNSKIAESIPAAQDYILIVPVTDLVVPQGSEKIITIKTRFLHAGILELGDSGNGTILKLEPEDIKVVGTSGQIYSASNKSGAYETNRIYLFKSKPVISTSYGTGMQGNGVYDIYKVNISADAKGSIAWHKMTFDIKIYGPQQLQNLELYEGNTLISTADMTNSGKVSFYPNQANSPHREVPAGTVKSYILRGTVTGYVPNSSVAIVVKLVGDAGENVLKPDTAYNIDSQYNSNFIWSDLNYGNTSSTAVNTAQWVNGRLVKGFDLPYAPNPIPDPTPSPAPTPDTPLPDPEPAPPTEIAKRLSGRLLLAVEDKGRIHYVNPDDLKNYEVTFGNVMKLFEDLALGISNNDLNQILVNPSSESDNSDRDGDGYSDKQEATNGYNPDIPSDPANRGNDQIKVNTKLSNRLMGKLLLQVEDRGRIWYIDQAAKRWEVTFGNVMNLFTSLALGITNQDLSQISAGN